LSEEIETKKADEWAEDYGLNLDSSSKQSKSAEMTSKEFFRTLEGLTQYN